MTMRRRKLFQVIPASLRELWSKWQLRVVVLSSLILQIVLIIFGNHRKYNRRTWIRFVIWFAYLAADSVATIALGVISGNLGEVYDDDGSVDQNVELNAFWTPFLLLHLGGPDTITAYSLEDNELWSRHFLGLVQQAFGTIYIILMAWTGSNSSHLSLLTILMTLAGLIKFGERTWVLRSASNDQLRDSMRITRSDPGLGNSNLVEEYQVRDAEGYNVIPNRVIELQLPVDSVVFEGNSISKDHELLIAYGLFQIFKGLFVDVILGYRDRDTSQTIFRSISYENAYKLIEIECGFMYDLLYTKAMLVHNPWGLCLRFISFGLTCIVLVFFSLIFKKQRYSKVDLSITFLLQAIAIFLEIYAMLVLISSDWTIVRLNAHNKASALLKAIASFWLFQNPRWSNSMAQYSLLSLTLEEKHVVCHRILTRLSIFEQLGQHKYVTHVEVCGSLKEWIFNHFKEKLREIQQETKSGAYNLGALKTARGNLVLEKYGHTGLSWTTEVEFDQSILMWHIATEICCNLEDVTDSIRSKHDTSNQLGQYMLYLLVKNPSMLPVGMGQFVFEDTCADVAKFISTEGKLDVHKKLLQQYTTGVQLPGERYISKKSVLSDACRLAEGLTNISNKEEKWSLIADVWVEILAYVAYQSNGRQHAEQLRAGGEFLTHVWLLMAHFGLTEHFQIPQRRSVARLAVR